MNLPDKGQVLSTLEHIRSLWTSGGVVSESDVTSKVVVPLLNSLGWDHLPGSRIKLEQHTGADRVDVALFCDGDCRAVVEVKAPTEVLGRHEKQLAGYAAFLGAEYALLTNGRSWYYYLPKKRGEFSSLLYVRIEDITASEATAVADVLSDLLSVTAMRAYASADAAERIQREQMATELADTIVQVLAELPPETRHRIAEVAERQANGVSIDVQPQIRRLASALTEDRKPLPSPVSPPSGDLVQNKLPTMLRIREDAIPVSNWRLLLLETVKWLLAKGQELPVGGPPGKMPVVSLTGAESTAYEKIGEYFINTRAQAPDYVDRARWLLERCGYSREDLSFETS